MAAARLKEGLMPPGVGPGERNSNRGRSHGFTLAKLENPTVKAHPSENPRDGPDKEGQGTQQDFHDDSQEPHRIRGHKILGVKSRRCPYIPSQIPPIAGPSAFRTIRNPVPERISTMIARSGKGLSIDSSLHRDIDSKQMRSPRSTPDKREKSGLTWEGRAPPPLPETPARIG